MIAGLKKIDSAGGNAVYQAVFLRDAARPAAREEIFQRLRLARALEWVAQHCLDQIEHP